MIRILVLDDDPEVRYGIYDYLKRDYEVYITKKENEVFDILNKTNINLIIFDYLMLNTEIKTFIDKIKEINRQILIMVISTPLTNIEEKCLLNNNIDDYMGKPLDMIKLEFRIEKLLKKQSYQYERIIRDDNLIINCETNSIIYNNENIEFFNKEFQILYNLFSYPNMVFSKEHLIELICNYEENINPSTIRTYINSIRRKINDIPELDIVTVRGVGYKGIRKNSNSF